MNSLLPQIAQQIYDQLPDAVQSQLNVSQVEEYFLREAFLEGGQGYLTKDEYPSFNKLTMLIKKPHPLVALVKHLSENRILLGVLTLTYDSFDSETMRALNKCAWVDFDDCIIEIEDFPQLNVIYTFLNCTFTKTFRLSLSQPAQLTELIIKIAEVSAVFEACIFGKDLVVDKRFVDEVALNLFAVVIGRCKQLNGLVLRGITLTTNPIAMNSDVGEQFLTDQIVLERVHFKENFDVSSLVANRLSMTGCTFDAKCTMDFSEIKQLMISDTKFNQAFSANSLKADKLTISQSSFDFFFSMARARFDVFTVAQASFQYSLDATDVHIGEDLSLHGAVLNQPSNFLGITFSKLAEKQIDRETFRIIKHSFDAVGNHIESNRFYAYEMEAYRREVKIQATTWHEKWLLMFNSAVSDHGQNYVKPIFWVLGAAIVLMLLKTAEENNWLYRLAGESGNCLNSLAVSVNTKVAQLPLFKHLMIEGIELLSLIIGLFMAAFIWQALVAFRRHAKR
ncbi:MAG: hypothetical protein IBX55_23305 [Methyloprofundus sp.]|nr:hypothetical protein [Methyloprofundus sp.]